MAKRVEGTRSPQWAFMKKMLIPCRDGIPYLFRIRVIQTPWFAIYLHDIFQPDTDADPHDHPFNFVSIILRGSYTERLFDIKGKYAFATGYKSHKRFSIHRMTKKQAHRIVEADPKLKTLVLVGPRKRGEWGFYTPHGFVKWDQYEELLSKKA